MDDAEEIATKTKQAIQDFVNDHWNQCESASYFSSIGIHLRRTIPESRTALPNGLGDFLRQNPVVRVVQFPGIPQKIGAVPLSVELPGDIRELFSHRTSTSPYSNRSHYLQEFWDAFIRPIDDSVRSIVVDKENRITVHEGRVQNCSGTLYTIEPQDLPRNVPNSSIAEKVSATHSAIDAWFQKHSVDPNTFRRAKLRKRSFAADNNLGQFLSAIEALPKEDLARIKMPLDILTKLASQK